jgi:hypothetical protein
MRFVLFSPATAMIVMVVGCKCGRRCQNQCGNSRGKQ